MPAPGRPLIATAPDFILLVRFPTLASGFADFEVCKSIVHDYKSWVFYLFVFRNIFNEVYSTQYYRGGMREMWLVWNV